MLSEEVGVEPKLLLEHCVQDAIIIACNESWGQNNMHTNSWHKLITLYCCYATHMQAHNSRLYI